MSKDATFDFRDNRIAYIHTVCWSFAMGGEHYTVKADCGRRKSIDNITYNLSRSQTLVLNRKEKGILAPMRYMVGDKCTRFFTEEEAIKVALNTCHKEWKSLKIVIHGYMGTVQPQRVIWCIDRKVKNSINRLYETMELFYGDNNDPWIKHEKTIEKLIHKWEKLMRKLLYND